MTVAHYSEASPPCKKIILGAFGDIGTFDGSVDLLGEKTFFRVIICDIRLSYNKLLYALTNSEKLYMGVTGIRVYSMILEHLWMLKVSHDPET
jgi:hypothetical protein